MSSTPLRTMLPSLPDMATRQAIRLVADSLSQLTSAIAQLQAASRDPQLTPALLAEIKASLEASGSHPLQLNGLTGVGGVQTITKIASEWLDSFNATTGVFTQSQPGAGNLSNGTTGSGAVVLATSPAVATPTLTQPQVAGATPTAAASHLGLGITDGFGAGAAGTAVTTTTKGAGAGPTTAETVVDYLKINIGGTDYWIPLMQ